MALKPKVHIGNMFEIVDGQLLFMNKKELTRRVKAWRNLLLHFESLDYDK